MLVSHFLCYDFMFCIPTSIVRSKVVSMGMGMSLTNFFLCAKFCESSKMLPLVQVKV